MKKHFLLLALLVSSSLMLGLFVGFFMPDDDDFFALRKNYQIFGSLYEELVVGYVDKLDPEKMMHTGIDAMLRDLDPYTNFYDEVDNADIDIMMRGRYGGVGLNAGVRNGKITVVAPVEGASAYLQGVRAGDIITQVAGQSTENLSLKDVRNLMRGEPGTAIEIVVERQGEPAPLNFLLTREEVKLKNVPFNGFLADDTLAGIGYIKLERFAQGAAQEVRQALQNLQKTGTLRGLVLDLRDNPGGLLEAAVEITALFVPQGSLIVSTRGRLPQSEQIYRSKAPPLAPDVPLIVLVSDLSASASEIVAGALQDLDRGVIVGVPTFGKGLVQIVKALPYNTSLKLTTARYYTPSGRSIQAIDYGQHDGNFTTIPDSLRRTFSTAAGRQVKDGRGIEPDVVSSFGEPSELEQALARRAAFFFFANHYAAQQPTPTLASEQGSLDALFQATNPDAGPQGGFGVTDQTLDAFRAWLQTQDFSYRTAAEHTVDDLAQRLAKIGYGETDDEVQALQEELLRQKALDFERYAPRLKQRLRAEILARYVGETAQIKALMPHDVQVRKAVHLLLDPAAYTGALQVR